METYCLINFNRRRGNINKSLEGLSEAMLRMWALQNTKPSQDTIIFSKEDGRVVCYVEGRKDNFPKVTYEGLGYADDYCPGLLAAVQEM